MLFPFLILEKMISIFPYFSMMLAIGLSYIPFIMLRYIPSILVSSELLSQKDVDLKAFSASIEKIMLFFL
jgi:hypothetical protein